MGAEKSKGDKVLKIPTMLKLAGTDPKRTIILPEGTDAADASEYRALIATLVDGDPSQEEIAQLEELTRTIFEVKKGRIELIQLLTAGAKNSAEIEQGEEKKMEQAKEALIRVGQGIDFASKDVYDVVIGYPTAESEQRQVFISSDRTPTVLLLDDKELEKDLQAVIDARLVSCERAVKTDTSFNGIKMNGVPMLGVIDGKEVPFILIPKDAQGSMLDFSIVLLPREQGVDASQAARTTFGGNLRVNWKKTPSADEVASLVEDSE